MAMSKKEIAEHAAEVEHWKMRAALTWTCAVEPDVPPPDYFVGLLTKGFLFSAHSAYVTPACSSSISHNFGSDDKVAIQHPRHLFSTKLLALRAMRHDMESNFAKKLLAVDHQIAHELETENE